MSGRLILASQSPRRQELLRLLTDDFVVVVSEADETLPEHIAPADAVTRLALRKARAVASLHPDSPVIGADTVVAVGGEILGKPVDRADAARMLRRLSGTVHQVYTGVALCSGAREEVFFSQTDVEFAVLSEQEISWYLATGEPFDKAGAYGIQGFASRFVKGIRGDFFNVMGLPVQPLYEKLGKITK